MKKFTLCLLFIIFTTTFLCANIRTITDGNYIFEIDDENGTATLMGVVDNTLPDIEIPTVAHEGLHTKYIVKILGNKALNGCSNITSLVVPGCIGAIYRGAFLGCTSLKHIEFEPADETLAVLSEWNSDGEKKLLEDAPLESISFSRKSLSISIYSPFDGKTTLKEAFIGKEAEEVPKYFFKDCTNLKKIELEDGLTKINWGAFRGCTSLESIVLPSTITEAGDFTFEGCTALTNLTIPSSLKALPSRFCDDCSALTSVVIPEGVEEIGTFAFYDCTALTYMSIPSTVSEIGDEAFRGCKALSQIDCDIVTPPEITNMTFYQVKKKECRLNVPQGSVDAYKAAKYWSDFFVATSEVTDMEFDEAAHAEWYTLGGIRLAEAPTTSGLYIMKKGCATECVYIP